VELPRVESVVFCEDFRLEASGKYTLLGVAASALTALSFPLVLKIAMWVAISPKEKGDLSAKFRVINREKATLVTGDLQAHLINTEKTMIVFGPFPLNLQSPDTVYLEWSLTGQKWVRIGTLQVNAPGPDFRPQPLSTFPFDPAKEQERGS
jgi:hypothetical protein